MGVLAIVEVALLRMEGRPYTALYRSTRRHPNRIVALAPLAAAAVVALHLEEKLPPAVDPLHQLGRLLEPLVRR